MGPINLQSNCLRKRLSGQIENLTSRSDTGRADRSQNASTTKPPEQTSAEAGHPGLVSLPADATYFASARVGGKLIRRSLNTATYSVALLRLNDLVKDSRGLVEAHEVAAGGAMTFQQAADALLQGIDADPTIKPATRQYRRRCLTALKRAWPGLAETDVKRITPAQCRDWAAKFAKAYSPTMYDNTVGWLLRQSGDPQTHAAGQLQFQRSRRERIIPGHRLHKTDFRGRPRGRVPGHAAAATSPPPDPVRQRRILHARQRRKRHAAQPLFSNASRISSRLPNGVRTRPSTSVFNGPEPPFIDAIAKRYDIYVRLEQRRSA